MLYVIVLAYVFAICIGMGFNYALFSHFWNRNFNKVDK